MNHQYFKVFSISIVLACCNVASAVTPQTKIEQKKYHVVETIYGMTDGALLICSRLPEEHYLSYQASVEKFWATFPNYRKLIESSPYYKDVKHKHAEMMISKQEQKNSSDIENNTVRECLDAQTIINESIERGRKGVEKSLSVLDEKPAK